VSGSFVSSIRAVTGVALAFFLVVAGSATTVVAQEKKDGPADPMSASTFAGLSFRSLGPALTSGRIGDIAVHPDDKHTWMVAVASGNVWLTENAGTTWTPVFDGEGSYSIGCVTYDPTNPLVVWVGTGENNSQRSVSYGDGVYKSIDGGRSWTNVGLGDSQHIGKILVHPANGNVVYVAAQGPLWNGGGDRGLYKSSDGGSTWTRILHISDDTGISDIVMDPRDPDVIYASAYQRRRHVWTLLNGGPEGGLHKTTDGGATWQKLERGLPKGDIGRIGLAVAPTNGNIVYAIVEAAGDGSGFYRSTDAGANFKKMSGYVSSSPQYYQEILVDPTDANVIYSNDVWFQRSVDGGATWTRLNDGTMHVDNHAVWIDPDDPSYILVGNDGGVYESFDHGQHWSFKTNLPVTQFYKIGLDEDFPFYNVYGGTQDNNTIGGPTRNTSANGIQNSDWFITVGGDGFEPAIDPTDPNVVYSQWQYGNLVRYDRKNGEVIDIQPQPAIDDEPFVWNWSSALLISPHQHTRLYFGGNYLFRSEDRGDSWTKISPDLTRQIDRNQLEIMGRVWSVDAVAKNRSTSIYGNIVSFDESPLVEDLLYVGTDDGLVWMSPDGGATWNKTEKFRGVPDMSYVTALTADRFDANVVYVTFSNHKKGDFAPYVLRSDDRGKSWRSIAGDLPERGQVHDVVQDHVDRDLLFVGTEFGVFFTRDGGKKWIQLKGGIPTIACHDLEIQRRENDLVVGTFGRGYYVLDDYSPLRHVNTTSLQENEAKLFPSRRSWMFFERSPLGLPGKSSMGHQHFMAPNPPVGAVFTYFLRDGLQMRKELRQASEKEIWQKGGNLSYPSWDDLRSEDRENAPRIVLTVRDGDGNVVRRVEGPKSAGLHRVHWDFRYPSPEPTDLSPPAWRSPWSSSTSGAVAMPGTYTVEISKVVDGVWTDLTTPMEFECEVLAQATLPAEDRGELTGFQREVAELQRVLMGTARSVREIHSRIDHVRQALLDTPGQDTRPLLVDLDAVENRLHDLEIGLRGDGTRARREEATLPGLIDRIDRVVYGYWTSSSAPTQTMRDNTAIVRGGLPALLTDLRAIHDDLGGIESELERRGGPWTPGRMPRFEGR
jgi:photosystem II stability/assembly factor-like uncharacterized protein